MPEIFANRNTERQKIGLEDNPLIAASKIAFLVEDPVVREVCFRHISEQLAVMDNRGRVENVVLTGHRANDSD